MQEIRGIIEYGGKVTNRMHKEWGKRVQEGRRHKENKEELEFPLHHPPFKD